MKTTFILSVLAASVPHIVASGQTADPMPRLLNISTRAETGAGDDVMILGFVVAGEEPKEVLIRGVGPSLAKVAPSLEPELCPDPEIAVYRDNRIILENDDWGGRGPLRQKMSDAGAFALDDSSRDAAIVTTLWPGSYTVHVRAETAEEGIVLGEVYDLDQDPKSFLVNVSTRAMSGTGDKVVIAGFVVKGDTKLLLRGIGPNLAIFDVEGYMTDPRLAIRDPHVIRGENDDWESWAQWANVKIGTPLEIGSADAALIYDHIEYRNPGEVKEPTAVPFTMIVDGKDGEAGIVLVEVFDLTK